MARLSFTLTAELDLQRDAINDLMRVREALPRRHGDRFRALERRIEALEDREWSAADVGRCHDLGEGILLFEPPPIVVELVAEARRLGVI